MTGNGKDKKPARLELTRRLMQLAPKARLDALVEEADARELVRSLPPEDLYYTIAEVGLGDATEIVQLASPEQFRAFVDLAVWRRDRLDPHELLSWLRAARGESGEELLAKLRGLDLELIELMFRQLTVVHDLEENPDVAVEGVSVQTAEGKYLVEIRVEGPELAALRQLIDDLLAENPLEASRFIEALRWEIPSELEETAYRFRSARLSDLGFPELEQASKLFSYVDPAKVAPASSTAPGGGASLEPDRGRRDFVEAAFSGLDSEERGAMEQEVRWLVNAALVAEGAEPGDPLAVRRVSELARDYLALGLEHLSGGEPSRASDRVRERSLREVFRLGFSLTLQLKFRAERLAKEPLARLDESWLLFDEEATALAALMGKRPLRALKVDGAEPVPFRSRRELAEASEILDRSQAQRAVFAALLGGSEEGARAMLARFSEPLAALGAERVFAAAVAMAVLEGRAEPRPVPDSRLVELCERLFEGDPASPRLREGAARKAEDALLSLVDEPRRPTARSMVARSLTRLLDQLARPYLEEGRVDPRAVTALPIVLAGDR